MLNNMLNAQLEYEVMYDFKSISNIDSSDFYRRLDDLIKVPLLSFKLRKLNDTYLKSYRLELSVLTVIDTEMPVFKTIDKFISAGYNPVGNVNFSVTNVTYKGHI